MAADVVRKDLSRGKCTTIPRLSQVLETVYIARGRPHEAFFAVVPCAELLQSTAGVRLVFYILPHRIYYCFGKLAARYTGDTVSLRDLVGRGRVLEQL